MDSAARCGQLLSVPRASIDEDLFTAGNLFKSITHGKKPLVDRDLLLTPPRWREKARSGQYFLRSITAATTPTPEVERGEPSEGESQPFSQKSATAKILRRINPKLSPKKQQDEQQSPASTAPVLLPTRNKQFQPRVQSRSDCGKHGFASI